jgi:hypothetical protein
MRGDTSKRRVLDVWLIVFERTVRRYFKRFGNPNLHRFNYFMKEYHRFFLYVSSQVEIPEQSFSATTGQIQISAKVDPLHILRLFTNVTQETSSTSSAILIPLE